MTTIDPTAPVVLDEETVSAYRCDGVVRIRNIIGADEAARFRDAAVAVGARAADNFDGSAIFNQYVNVWRQDAVLRDLTLDQRLTKAATALAGVPLRLWHDQVLIKPPHNGAATEFHQDAPYWPHGGSRHALSAFHNAYLAHSATPNLTDDPRIAHVAIYIDAGTTYTGAPHVVTDGLGLTVGEPLEHELFPRVLTL